MKRLKINLIVFSFAVLYLLYICFLRQGQISMIYQHVDKSERWSCISTVVLVDNVPFSRYAQKKMWIKYSNTILEKTSLLTPECDSIIFLKNKTERANDVGDTHYWANDDQYCLNGAFGNEQCISKEEQLFVIQLRRTTLDDEKIGLIDKKPIYIHFIDY